MHSKRRGQRRLRSAGRAGFHHSRPTEWTVQGLRSWALSPSRFVALPSLAQVFESPTRDLSLSSRGPAARIGLAVPVTPPSLLGRAGVAVAVIRPSLLGARRWFSHPALSTGLRGDGPRSNFNPAVMPGAQPTHVSARARKGIRSGEGFFGHVRRLRAVVPRRLSTWAQGPLSAMLSPPTGSVSDSCRRPCPSL